MAGTSTCSRPGYDSFLKHLKELESAVTDPGGLAVELYSNGLIDRVAKERASLMALAPIERSRELLQKLEDKIESHEAAFEKFLSILVRDPTFEDICMKLRATRDELKDITNSSRTSSTHHNNWLTSWKTILIGVSILIVLLAVVWSNTHCYQLGLCHSKSLPSVRSHFVGREEDIRNITGYLDFYISDVQVVHIVGPPGFGKSTLAMKIGEIFLRKWVSVHYVDVGQKMVKDIDTLAEKIVLSMVESRKTKVTFSDLEEKIRKQYSKALIILDNCDEILEHSKEEFLGALKSLTALSQRSVRYLLTSQKWAADIGNFRLHAIYNLSCEAAIQLLSTVASSLTDDQKKQIADLTGNVPLALEVIGAIFWFPDAPTPEMVIKGLKEHLLDTLSPTELHSTVDVSIRIAYSYLTPELKQLCVNLSHIPGSFDESSIYFLFDFSTDIRPNLANLVQRSLLQSSHGRQRYHFHQLIKTFCLGQENRTSFQQHFDTQFQSYFTAVLQSIISDYVNGSKLTTFDEEKQNICHMFSFFKRANNKTITFNGIRTTLQAIEMNVLQLRFLPVEINNISQDLLAVLDSYTPHEQAMVNSFLDTYIKVVELVAKQQWPICKVDAIETLTLREERVNEGHKSRKIFTSTFTKFYSLLIQYYEENGDTVNSARCHTHVLKTIHGKLTHCYPDCDYYDISVAYKVIGDRKHGFRFRELAYEHQRCCVTCINQAWLFLDLYNDYLRENESLKANELTGTITEDTYNYLMMADKSEYQKELYFIAVRFFRAQNSDNQVVELEKRMINNSVPCSEINCDRSLRRGKLFERLKSLMGVPEALTARCDFICAAHYAEQAQEAYNNECYHLAIWAGEQSGGYIDKLGEPYTVLKFELEYIVGRSYYEIGSNYSATLISLKQAVKHINDAIRLNYFSLKLRETRTELCSYIIRMNWICNPLFYIHLIKDFTLIRVILLAIACAKVPFSFWETFFQREESFLSTENILTEQKYSFIWSQFHAFYSYMVIIGQWIIVVFYFVLLFFGTLIVCYGYFWCFYYYILLYCRKVLYFILLIALIMIITDWL